MDNRLGGIVVRFRVIHPLIQLTTLHEIKNMTPPDRLRSIR